MAVKHKSAVFKNRWGANVTTTYCGRMDNSGNDLNIAESDSEVSCKLCLKIMSDPKHYMHRKIASGPPKESDHAQS